MKKKEIKPLNSIRHDFVASLNKALHEATMLLIVVEVLIRDSTLTPSVAAALKKRTDAMRLAFYGEDEDVGA